MLTNSLQKRNERLKTRVMSCYNIFYISFPGNREKVETLLRTIWMYSYPDYNTILIKVRPFLDMEKSWLKTKWFFWGTVQHFICPL